MRYRLKLINCKNNYIRLPNDSPLRQAIANSIASAHGSSGLGFYFESERSHCAAIKVQSLSSVAYPAYFGYAGGISAESNTVELSREAAAALGLDEDLLVSVQIEYSYQKLQHLELEPATADDFEIVEQNSSQIEEQLLNQVGVFFRGQTFVLFLGQQGTVVRLRSVIDARNSSNCYYLTESCELHIAAKARPKHPVPV
jgi:Peroxisome biogenesis factor 1, N-terminal